MTLFKAFQLLLVALFCGAFFTTAEAKTDKLAAQREAFAKKSQNVIVRFSGQIADGLPVTIRPLVLGHKSQRDVPYKVDYRFTNLSDKPVRIRAVHQITPDVAETSFKKLTCFCFENQVLAPNETKDMPVVYVLSPDLPKDVDTVYLNYVVFKSTEVETTH